MLLTCFVFTNTSQGAGEKYNCSFCHETMANVEITPEHPYVGEPDSQLFQKISELMQEIGKNGFLASFHLNSQVTCCNCHGTRFEIGVEVQTQTCLQCHGSYAELAEQTGNQELEGANPHQSHLGEVDCTVCHHAHSPSVSYCLQCHVEFAEIIPPGG